MPSTLRHIRAVGAWSRLAVATALAMGWGCGSSSAPRQCHWDSDCGAAGAVCRAGACQVSLVLSITSPDDGAATNGTLHVAVAVEGGQPAAVELVLTAGASDSRLTTIGPPLYEFDWDTHSTPEGSYALRARTLAGKQTYESLPIAVTVDRTPPPAPTIIVDSETSAQPVPVHGIAKEAATVSVYEGAKVLAQVAVDPKTDAWSASIPLLDGPHSLTASAVDRAGNPSVDASTVGVNCVRNNPTVLYRVPAPSQPPPSNVWSRDPITVTFSRAMNHTSVEASLKYYVDGQAQGASFAWKRTAQDGSQIDALTIMPVVLPDVTGGSATVTVDLSSAMTDTAGNALTVPSDAWTWTVPVWQDLGAVGSGGKHHDMSGVLVVGKNGNPVVALAIVVPGVQALTLKAWTGSAWTDFTPTSSSAAISPAVALDAAGSPAMAWLENGSNLHAATWNGTSWEGGSTALNVAQANAASSPSVAVDRDGGTAVAWLEAGNAYVKRWKDGAWTQLGPGALNSGAASYVLASLEESRRLFVTWIEGTSLRASAWAPDDTGTSSWTPGAGWPLSEAPGAGPYLVSSPSGRPFAAWLDTSGLVPLAEVSQLGTQAWAPKWDALGGKLNVDSGQAASTPWLTLDATGSPVVAWREGSSPAALYAKRWVATDKRWQSLGIGSINPALASSPEAPVVSCGPDGTIAVLWREDYQVAPSVYGYSLEVRRYNH